jgi:hypothetical protein
VHLAVVVAAMVVVDQLAQGVQEIHHPLHQHREAMVVQEIRRLEELIILAVVVVALVLQDQMVHLMLVVVLVVQELPQRFLVHL